MYYGGQRSQANSVAFSPVPFVVDSGRMHVKNRNIDFRVNERNSNAAGAWVTSGVVWLCKRWLSGRTFRCLAAEHSNGENECKIIAICHHASKILSV